MTEEELCEKVALELSGGNVRLYFWETPKEPAREQCRMAAARIIVPPPEIPPPTPDCLSDSNPTTLSS